jgi:hypothetical protein
MRMNMFTAQDKAKPNIKNATGLHLVAVLLMTIHRNKLLLQHKIGMNCVVKPGLTEDLYSVK